MLLGRAYCRSADSGILYGVAADMGTIQPIDPENFPYVGISVHNLSNRQQCDRPVAQCSEVGLEICTVLGSRSYTTKYPYGSDWLPISHICRVSLDRWYC
jgi:hypothetical protein